MWLLNPSLARRAGVDCCRIGGERALIAVVLAWLTSTVTGTRLNAAELPPPPPQAVRATEPLPPGLSVRRFALIVAGLPGDAERGELFEQTVLDWSDSLKSLAGVTDDRLFILSGAGKVDGIPAATRENIQGMIREIVGQLQTEDSLWVLFLGHGSYDGQHTRLHLPGPDLHEGEWADLFARLNCREQVFWLTQSASGGFVRALSRSDRIVMAATQATGEVNETRFPHALTDVLRNDPAELDVDGDGSVSVLELFRATNDGVVAHFEENELAATEHSQLDDNADGAGSEAADLIEPGVVQLDPAAPQIDGALAAKTIVTTIIAAGDSSGANE